MHPAEDWDATTVVASAIMKDLSFMIVSIVFTKGRRLTLEKDS